MDTSLSLRRLVENEAYFRQKNRAIEEGFQRIKEVAAEDGQAALINDEDLRLYFYCECSDEKCRKRIPLKRSQYDAIHKSNNHFVIMCDHEVPAVERIVEKSDTYCVVEKKIDPPTGALKLNPTRLNNS